MTRRKMFPILVAIVATAMFILPGLALGEGGGKATPSPPPTNPPCDADGHNGSPPPYGGPKLNTGSCKNVRTTDGGSTSGGSTTGSTGSTDSTGSTGHVDTTGVVIDDSGLVCDTDGVLGSKGLGLLTPDDRTIGQIMWDELGLVVQDPGIPGDGPLSQPLYDGLIQIPLGGLETPIAAEAACLLNNLSL